MQDNTEYLDILGIGGVQSSFPQYNLGKGEGKFQLSTLQKQQFLS